MTDLQQSELVAATRRVPDWTVILGVLFVLGMAALLLYYNGVTFHGPDQIRDMALARALLHDGVWPLQGPPQLGGHVFLPPAFYWLLTLPLLLHDSETTVFLVFGAAFVLSVGYVWHRVRRALGPACALIYVLLAFPIFATSYAHSAWNPALAMTLSNLLLGLFIDVVAQRKRGWLLLPWAFALLLQVHPSAAPLAVGLLLYALCHPRVLWHPRTLLSLALLAAALAFWVWRAGWPVDLLLEQGSSGPQAWAPALAAWAAHLGNVAAWRDFVLLPWNLVRSIQPNPSVATPVAAVHVLLLWSGVVAVLPALGRDRVCRWVAVVAGLWLLLAMAFLASGLFWYGDVILPWLAVLSAAGWSGLLRRLRVPQAVLAMAGVALFAGLFAGHLDFYRSWQRSGKLTMQAALLEFPRGSDSEPELPGYSYDYLERMRQILQSRSVCPALLAGIEATVMRDLTARGFDVPCRAAAPDSAPAVAYFMGRPRDAAGFVFAQGLAPLWQVEQTRIYSPPYVPVTINGHQRSRFEGQHSAPGFGFGFPPQQLPGGLRIGVLAPGQSVVLRVGLRCDGDAVVQPEHWLLRGAHTLAPPHATQRRHFMWIYRDVEWQLKVEDDVEEAQILSGGQPLPCDVTAIARSL